MKRTIKISVLGSKNSIDNLEIVPQKPMNLNDIIIGVDKKINPKNKFGKMKHIKAYYQILHEVKELNGFKWFGYCENSKGEYMHHFQKQEGKKWIEIKATEEDLENGNIEFMTLKHLSR